MNSAQTNQKLPAILREAVKAGLLESFTFQSEGDIKFDGGFLAVTPQAKQVCEDMLGVEALLKRHCSGDFGNLGNWDDYPVSQVDLDNLPLIEDDLKLNKLAALGHYPSILSEYVINDQIV